MSDYGLIGNMETCALVSRYGSIDWCPLPELESPSVFAAILDDDRGGYFQLQPIRPYQAAQRYIERTNVLVTDYYIPTGRATLLDWMSFTDDERTAWPRQVIYRKLKCTDGDVRVTIDFQPSVRLRARRSGLYPD